jgi:SAM-dependent methyltransferase
MAVTLKRTGVTSQLGLVAAAYTAQFQEHGACHKGVLWDDVSGQRSRFNDFLYLLERDEPGRSFSVNDLGCGYGAFFEFLKQRVPGTLHNYRGYDICPELVADAQAHMTDPRASFFLLDVADVPCDYSFASGTFNLMIEADKGNWTAYVKHSLQELWKKSERGLAFNLLDEDAVFMHQP